MLSRKAVLCVILLFASTLVTTATAQTAAQPKGSPAPEKVIAIHAANLIDGVSNQVRHNVLVVIKGNRIESVTSGGNPPAGATVINLARGRDGAPRADRYPHAHLSPGRRPG